MKNELNAVQLSPEDLEAMIESEFEEVFGRPADAYDRRLGLARAIEVQRDLANFRPTPMRHH